MQETRVWDLAPARTCKERSSRHVETGFNLMISRDQPERDPPVKLCEQSTHFPSGSSGKTVRRKSLMRTAAIR